ncbi:putative U box domain, armadillo-like helical, Zinc finger, RING/FYVE/PHD-type [Helianthus annuus]|uniref:RING-type E3 ubiquitin transferase n=1 Tax=Helianthus annuus TaxID=4232 RepID=A0A251RML6_HELAN|nr:U-box domain-containing protein 45 [Helianthus annuus]KAF5754137.1 putative U box domain, armadillo-like helical, Zinc finger, RING/FYVE/PHD-type [Helianthus annuus]KAJ0635227.1 putative U box domain, armadillo-like helical, Zinc finger, RING/FYVE/PHD-type [Helianthus annuus]KAJ0823785.1 putative U box domain, armadillo-like helical, Zinc finger, RING/FYVE/PHD-type [Helianthus annuus]
MMDNSEIEENLFALGEPKLHGGMCSSLSLIYAKVLTIFPDLEAARPRSTTGIQALCSLHIALEKAKTLLQHCAECSKLYLAITGDSVVMKFEKAKSALEDSLRRVEDIVPQTIGSQIADIIAELKGIEFSLDPSEKQIGDEIIGLLQEGRNLNSSCENGELETFHQAATKLGINSSRGALRERRALKKVLEKSRIEDDKRKESIVAYLLHLMKKYSKLFRSDFSDDNDSQSGSTPCSPTVHGSFENVFDRQLSKIHGFDRQLSKMSSFNFKPNFRRSGQMPVPPDELRCPISLQLMYDPVIIASGQTYERICIEKWFENGHNTCPKTHQTLAHLCLTPNYCVKGLVANWCEQNGILVPEGPPDSLDDNYWNISLTESEPTSSRFVESIGSCKYEKEGDELEVVPEDEGSTFDTYEGLLASLTMENKRIKAVEKIRLLTKDDEEARIFMGANGFVEALLQFFESTVRERNLVAQESVAMALFNLSVNNNRNKETMLAAGVLPLLVNMIGNSGSPGAVAALCLNLSSLEQAKAVIGLSEAVPFLIRVLNDTVDPTCKSDALIALYHLSTLHSNIPRLVSLNILDALQPLIDDDTWTEKVLAILSNMVNLARDEIVSTHGLVSGLSSALDMNEPNVQEQAAACLLTMCTGNETCIQMVLQEGVIPSLVSVSANGSARGKQKAQKLLLLFREQRHQDPPVVQDSGPQQSCEIGVGPVNEEVRPLTKQVSKRKLGRGWSSLWRNKSFLVHQC